MAIRKRGKTWWIDIITPGGHRVRQSAETSDRKAAQELHDKLKNDLWRQAKLGDKPKYTWEDAALRWLNEQGHKASIRDDAKKIEFLTPFFRRLPLTELTRDRLQAVIEGQKGDKAPATRNRYYQLVRSILRRAMREWTWIDTVPTIRLHREPEGRVRYLTPREIDTLLRNLPEHLCVLTRFTFATGLRRANVLGLKWSQIDMSRQIMMVAARDIKSRKTLGIPLNATAMEILREQIGKHAEFVFVYKGRPLNATVNTAWRNALKKSGIEDFRFHDTRHTWASLLIQNGVPKGMIKEMGGWKSDSMVERYAHLAPEHLARHAAVLDEIFLSDSNCLAGPAAISVKKGGPL
jgi:integrase